MCQPLFCADDETDLLAMIETEIRALIPVRDEMQ
jgi:hypothetical protein